MNQVKLEKYSKISTNNVGNFIENFIKLLQLFKGKIDSEAFKDINSKWNLARQALGCDREIVDYIYEYFLIFEKEILSGDDQAMLEFDYTTLIAKDCEQSTRNLILTLTDNIKQAYKQGDRELNENIKTVVTRLAKCSITHKKIKNAMNKL